MSKVIVIGAGIGGLACGALLAKDGYKVEVFEKNPFAGGRCSATEMKGFTIDNFVHAFPLGGKGPHAAVARELGADLEFIVQDPAAMIVDGLDGGARSYPQRLDIRPFMNRFRMARNMGVKKSNLFSAYRLFQRILKADDEFIASKDDTTIRDFLLEYTDDPQLHRFINVLSFMMFTLPYGRASAGEFIHCFRDMAGAANFGYVRGSSGAIPAAYRQALENNGGKLHLGRKVQRIQCEEGRVRGVVTGEGEVEGDVVISNAGIQNTVTMAGEESLGGEYAKMAKSLIYSDSAVVVKYILDEPVVKYPFIVYIPDADAEEIFFYTCADNIPRDVYIFMPVIDLWDPSLVPGGKQLIIAGAGATNRPSRGDSHTIIQIMERRIFSLFPGFEEHVTWREEVHAEHIQATTGHPRFADCVGLAQIPGQVGADKPSPITPVQGLYLVGAEAGARGIGTEQAAGSALAVSALVRGRHPL